MQETAQVCCNFFDLAARAFYDEFLMALSSAVFDKRRSTRVQLSLPIRLRWQEPLRQNIETAETLDVSRSGLLFYRVAPLPVNSRVWVTYPYSPEDPAGLAETPARVVRVKTTPGGSQLVALELESPRRMAAAVGSFNRRGSPRTALALPIAVRWDEAPWPEQAMTIDISGTGLLYRTARQYDLGEVVKVTVAHGIHAARGEMEARVVRIEPIPDSAEQRVALALPGA